MPKFWQCLDEIRGLVAVPAEWRAWLGTDFDAVKAAFLRKRPDRADSIPCPRELGGTHGVVPHGEKFVAVCECGCPDTPLMPADVEMWELNPSKLGRAICKAFDCDARATELQLPLTWQVGVKFSNAVPVVLTIQNDRDDFRNVVAELVARWRQPFILFAPTSRFVDGVGTELLAGSRAGFFDLESHLNISENWNLSPKSPPGKLFQAFAPDATEPDGDDVVRQAWGLLERLDDGKEPSMVRVFKLYGKQEKTAEQVAVACGCSKGTVINRLAAITKKTGLKPADLRRLSAHIGKVESELESSPAKHIHRRALVHDNKEQDDESG
jgi:hypothetical protein